MQNPISFKNKNFGETIHLRSQPFSYEKELRL